MLLAPPRSPSPPVLSHLREDSPDPDAPYTRPAGHENHSSFAAFVLDPTVAYSYRTPLLSELQSTTDNLVQGEAALRRALGRLWKVLSEDRPGPSDQAKAETKREDDMETEDANGRVPAEDEGDDELNDRERRLARAPDLTLPVNKLFLSPLPVDGASEMPPSRFETPQMQLENMEKFFAVMKEVQDQSREYVERLDEIREGLGDVKRQRDIIWLKARKQALEELKAVDQEVANGHDEV